MLQPKRTKYRKAHKGRIKGAASSAATLNFGTFGLKAQGGITLLTFESYSVCFNPLTEKTQTYFRSIIHIC